jgi:hypothetical protein
MPRPPRRSGADVRAVSLDVLVFGPSPDHPLGAKRVQIRDDIILRNPRDRVWFPEDLIAADNDLATLARERSAYAVERLLLEGVDAVITLLIDDPFATGAVTELAQFLTEDRLHSLFYVIEPAPIRALTERNPPPYTFELLNALHPRQRFRYTLDELRTCTAIRNAVDRRLLAVRMAKRQPL